MHFGEESALIFRAVPCAVLWIHTLFWVQIDLEWFAAAVESANKLRHDQFVKMVKKDLILD